MRSGLVTGEGRWARRRGAESRFGSFEVRDIKVKGPASSPAVIRSTHQQYEGTGFIAALRSRPLGIASLPEGIHLNIFRLPNPAEFSAP